MALLYSNENIPRPVVESPRLLGHDVMTVLEASKANRRIPDDAMLVLASRLQRIGLTINARDFWRLHRQRAGHTHPTANENEASSLHQKPDQPCGRVKGGAGLWACGQVQVQDLSVNP